MLIHLYCKTHRLQVPLVVAVERLEGLEHDTALVL